jgi:uncharacterized membrane protein
MDDTALMLILRLVHVLGGIVWVGWAVVAAAFVLPTVMALGPEGGRFMQGLMARRLMLYITAAMVLTLISGFWMYVIVPGELSWAWVTSGMGLSLGLGGLLGIAGGLVGILVSMPTAKRLSALGQAIQAAGAPPSPGQAAEIGMLRSRIRMASIIAAVLLALAAAAMSVARYL